MKSRFLFLFGLIMLFAFSVEAQNNATLMSMSGDTVSNTGTKAVTIKVPNSSSSVSVQVVNTKVSGTVAGNSLFQASNDGTNWVTLDTLANANVTTNTKIFTDVPAKYLWYRVQSTGVGTMVYVTRGYALIRR